MRNLLWIGDAGCPTGFAKSTHHICDWLDYRSNSENPTPWNVSVLGLNYRGDPEVRRLYPYDIYPAQRVTEAGGDFLGLTRLPEVMAEVRPSVVIIQNDPWNLPQYLELLRGIPVIAVLAVDGLNCRSHELNGLNAAIFWTQFGATQARLGGYSGKYGVIGLGVDLNVYKPVDRTEARRRFFRPRDFDRLKDVFIVSNVNRNQPRKRMDLTISYFCEWVKSYDVHDAYLHLHAAPTGDSAYDLQQLMQYYGLANRLILSSPDVWKGVDEPMLANNYCIADVGLSTTQGEGWGLTTMEMMACGVPQIVPNWAAMSEWPLGSVIKIPCSSIACTINGINVIGGVPDRDGTISGLRNLYDSPSMRTEYRDRGLIRVEHPDFRWENIGATFGATVEAALDVLGVSVIRQTTKLLD